MYDRQIYICLYQDVPERWSKKYKSNVRLWDYHSSFISRVITEIIVVEITIAPAVHVEMDITSNK